MTRLWRRRRRVSEPVRCEPRPGVRVLACKQDLDGAIARAVAQERATARLLDQRIARYDAMKVPRYRSSPPGGLGPLLDTRVR